MPHLFWNLRSKAIHWYSKHSCMSYDFATITVWSLTIFAHFGKILIFGDCHKNFSKSETVWATYWCCTFLESWEPKQSAAIRNKAVGHMILPQLLFEVQRFSRILEKFLFLLTVTKTFLNPKRFGLQINAVPF